MSVVKPRRLVGSGAGVDEAPGEAAGDPGAAGEAEASGVLAAGVPDAAGVALAAGVAAAGVPLAAEVAVAAGVGVASTDGRGVSDSTGPGVSSAAHTYAFVFAPWKNTKPMSRRPARNAPPMIQERYFSKTVCWRERRTLRDGLPVDVRVVEAEDVGGVVGAEADAEMGVGVASELVSASPVIGVPVVAGGRVVELTPRAGRRDFLAK
jgi:hypothetical protein